MKRLICYCLLSFFLTGAIEASITEKYLRVFSGVNFVDFSSSSNETIDAKTGYVVGGAYGYKYDWPFRMETEVAYRANSIYALGSDDLVNDIESFRGHLSKWTFLWNMFFDIPSSGFVNPYLGGGLGSSLEIGKAEFPAEEPLFITKIKYRVWEFAYQAIIGLNFQYFKFTNIRIDYRYLANVPHHNKSHAFAFSLAHSF